MELFYVSVLTLGEIRKGIALLKELKRQVELQAWLEADLVLRFAGRILSVDSTAADRWGRLTAQVGSKTALRVIDGLMAATALHHNLTFVTRNTKDVARTGVPFFQPLKRPVLIAATCSLQWDAQRRLHSL